MSDVALRRHASVGPGPSFEPDLTALLAAIDVRTLGPRASELVSTAMLDALAVAIDGGWLPVVRAALGSVSASAGPCTIWATNRTTSAPDAAFLNGVMMHATLRDDVGSGGFAEGTHPGCYVIPAALAVAEEHDVDGADLLSAIVAGYEAAARIAATAPSEVSERGFHSLPVIGVFGAAAAAGRALGLDAAGLETALDLAAHMSGGLSRGRFEGGMEATLQAGIAARNGVHAALLARSGVAVMPGTLGPDGLFLTLSGAPAAALPVTPVSVENLALQRVKHKAFPVHGAHEETVRLVTRCLAEQAPLAEPDIESVTVRRPRAGSNRIDESVLRNPPYENMVQVQLSAKFTTAAALLGRPVHDLVYYAEDYADAEVAALIERCTFIPHDSTAIDIVVLLKSGETLRLHDDAVGSAPEDPSFVRQKFHQLVDPVLGDKAVEVERALDSIQTAGGVRWLLHELRSTS
jgi:2-methylcitrate dehydratase PrpD